MRPVLWWFKNKVLTDKDRDCLFQVIQSKTKLILKPSDGGIDTNEQMMKFQIFHVVSVFGSLVIV